MPCCLKAVTCSIPAFLARLSELLHLVYSYSPRLDVVQMHMLGCLLWDFAHVRMSAMGLLDFENKAVLC